MEIERKKQLKALPFASGPAAPKHTHVLNSNQKQPSLTDIYPHLLLLAVLICVNLVVQKVGVNIRTGGSNFFMQSLSLLFSLGIMCPLVQQMHAYVCVCVCVCLSAYM